MKLGSLTSIRQRKEAANFTLRHVSRSWIIGLETSEITSSCGPPGSCWVTRDRRQGCDTPSIIATVEWRMSALTLFGLFAVSAMLVCYALACSLRRRGALISLAIQGGFVAYLGRRFGKLLWVASRQALCRLIREGGARLGSRMQKAVSFMGSAVTGSHGASARSGLLAGVAFTALSFGVNMATIVELHRMRKGPVVTQIAALLTMLFFAFETLLAVGVPVQSTAIPRSPNCVEARVCDKVAARQMGFLRNRLRADDSYLAHPVRLESWITLRFLSPLMAVFGDGAQRYAARRGLPSRRSRGPYKTLFCLYLSWA